MTKDKKLKVAKVETAKAVKAEDTTKKDTGLKLVKSVTPEAPAVEKAKTEKVKAVKAKAVKEATPPAEHCKPEIETAIANSPCVVSAPKDKQSELTDKARRNAQLVNLPIYNALKMNKNKQVYSTILGLVMLALGKPIKSNKNYGIMAKFGMYYTKTGVLCTEFFGKYTMYLPYVDFNVGKYSGWTADSLERAKAEDFKNVFEAVAKVYEMTSAEISSKVLTHLKDCKLKATPVIIGTIKQVKTA
jgi:hypothetical protein